jgi:hypothetical protein
MTNAVGRADDRAQYARAVQGLLRSGAEPFFSDGARGDTRRAHVNAVEIKRCLRNCSIDLVEERVNGDWELICEGETRQKEKMKIVVRICGYESVPTLRITGVKAVTSGRDGI